MSLYLSFIIYQVRIIIVITTKGYHEDQVS